MQDMNFPPLLYTEQNSTGIECGFFAKFEFPATCVYRTQQYTLVYSNYSSRNTVTTVPVFQVGSLQDLNFPPLGCTVYCTLTTKPSSCQGFSVAEVLTIQGLAVRLTILDGWSLAVRVVALIGDPPWPEELSNTEKSRACWSQNKDEVLRWKRVTVSVENAIFLP